MYGVKRKLAHGASYKTREVAQTVRGLLPVVLRLNRVLHPLDPS